MEFSEIVNAGMDVEVECIHEIESEAAIRALQQLNDIDRSIIYLRYFTGLSYREIAEYMGLKEKNVGVTLCRAIKNLEHAIITATPTYPSD